MANLDQLARQVAERLTLPTPTVDVVVEAFLEQVVETLARGEPVYLPRFGRWDFGHRRDVDERAARVCHFRFRRRLEQRLNRINAGLDPCDLRRLDYKRRQLVTRLASPRSDEADRRTRHGITLGAILDRLNAELAGH